MITLTDTTGKEGLHWIYLSPHLDDAALSCGGLIWEQTRAGEQASIWTICAGDAPDAQLSPFAESLHLRWQAGPQAADERRLEDLRSCERLNASCKHFSLPDCIYRRSSSSHDYFYDSEQAIFWPAPPGRSRPRKSAKPGNRLTTTAALRPGRALGFGRPRRSPPDTRDCRAPGAIRAPSLVLCRLSLCSKGFR